jgi:hypothetical protein
MHRRYLGSCARHKRCAVGLRVGLVESEAMLERQRESIAKAKQEGPL